MKWNTYLIREELKDILIADHIRSKPDRAVLQRIRICPQLPEETEKDTLYVTTAEALKSKKGVGAFICPGMTESRPAGDLLCVREELSLYEIYNRLEEVISRYEEWERSLQEVIALHLPARELFVRSASVIHNAMLAANEEFGFLFFHNPTDQNVYKESPVFAPHIEKVTLGNTGMKDLLQDADFVKTLNSRRPIYYPGSSRRRKKLIQNIFMRDSLVARLIIDGVDADITEKDILLIQILAEYLSRSISESNVALTNQPKDIEDLLRSFFDQSYENRNRYLRILTRYHWSDEDTYLCISLSSDKIANRDNVLNIFSLNLCHNIREAYFVRNNDESISIVIDLTRNQYSVEKIAEICTGTAASLNMYYGISRSCRSIYDLHYAWRQSLFAVRIARRQEKRLVYFDDCQLEYYLSEFFRENTADMAMPDGLQRLLKYDEENDTQLVRCLSVFLENQGNYAESARKLYMHRNTLLYQVEKIREVSEMDLDSPNTRIVLQIALKAMEYGRV
ncbi:MAG: helix-turn-helix domain-containing protein [Erysipelotrichaceae bacterium]|nr:helix-turn-helix domain-containing protein [Erysipelotrichaceae bacterium]